LKGYVKRRSLRILPPYYAALIVSIFVYMIYNGGNLPAGGQLISHAFLVHNATAEWLHGISAPLWSVAVEWQIYFVFALLLLPIWRTLGGVAVIVAAMLIGVGPLYVLPTGRNLEWFCPWYVVLFAMGMLAAAAGVVAKADGYHRRWNVYAIIAGVFTIVAFLLPELGGEFWARALRMEHRGASWLLDVGVGITVSFGLMSLTQSVMSGNGALNLRIVRTLQSKPIALLGAFSYSLYLIHAPLIALLALGIHRMQLSPLVGYVTLYAVGIPLGLTGAFLFYLAIERHCMGGRRATRPARKTGQDVFAEPAAGASAVQV
jgi:peptidoglycan/LPS O-acetylase OafA/YrhL